MPSDPAFHLSIRLDYNVHPYILEPTVCGLIVDRWLTRSLHNLPCTIEELRRLHPGSCAVCAETAYAAREELVR